MVVLTVAEKRLTQVIVSHPVLRFALHDSLLVETAV